MAHPVYVMGPSGAGKDSLLAAVRPLLQELPIAFARRYITRPAGSGEWHIPVSPERFAALESAGAFALSWRSHNLAYGISASADQALAHGITLVINGSRAALPRAVQRYPDLVPILVEADPEVVRARLAQRGREKGADLEERLAGAHMPLPHVAGMAPCLRVDNSGALADAAAALAALLKDLVARERFPETGPGASLGTSLETSLASASAETLPGRAS